MIGKVLVAEDNRVTQQLIKAMLEKKCQDVVTVKSGGEIIEKLSNDTYEILLLDYHLDITADNIISQIRSLDNTNSEIAIYVISASKESNILASLKQHSIKGFIQKPIEPKNLDAIFSHPTNESFATIADIKSNKSILQTILGDNEDRIASVNKSFITEVLPAINKIDQFLAAKKFEEAKNWVHRIRPAYTYMGRDDLELELNEWEQDLIQNRNVNTYSQRLNHLKKETNLMIKTIDSNASSSLQEATSSNILFKNIASKVILIIEDNPIILSAFTSYLENNKLKVVQATNGAEGIASAGRDQPDLILMDINLPEVNGIDAITQIRNSGSKIPIYAMSTTAEFESSALSAGANGFLLKPIDGGNLLKLIAENIS